MTLLAILPFLAVLATLSAFISYHRITSTRLSGIGQMHSKALSYVFSKLLRDEYETDPPTSMRTSQLTYQGSPPIARQIVVLGSQLPIIDFESALRGQSPCPFEQPYHYLSLSGFSLTPSSLVSPRSCSEPLTTERYNGNLDISRFRPATSLVAALGYIDVGELVLTSNTSIIAAGDLHISQVRSAANLELSLLSTTGVIVIDAASPLVSFRAAAFAGVYLPSGAIPAQLDPTVLPTISRIILGISRPDG